MGLTDRIKGLVGGHKDQAKQGIDKAASVADEKTGGSHPIRSLQRLRKPKRTQTSSPTGAEHTALNQQEALGMGNITDIEGVGDVYGAKLKDSGIITTEALLEGGRTPKGRAELAEKTGISERHILAWVNRSDLFRTKGVAGQHSELLEAAGVDTVVELPTRNPSNLTPKLHEVNEDKHLVRSVPSDSDVADWIEQAKTLPRVVTY